MIKLTENINDFPHKMQKAGALGLPAFLLIRLDGRDHKYDALLKLCK
jgi:hypothetical protein